MAFNFFEGGRRLAMLVGGIIALTGAYYAYDAKPYTSIKYDVPFVNGAPVKTSDSCPYNGKTEYLTKTTPDGHSVSITLCFQPAKTDSGDMLIPYKTEGQKFWANTTYSNEVSKYADSYKSNFIIPPADAREIDKNWFWSRVEAKWDVLKATLMVLGGLWLFVFVVGWIVRGFAGIQQGQDHRPKNN